MFTFLTLTRLSRLSFTRHVHSFIILLLSFLTHLCVDDVDTADEEVGDSETPVEDAEPEVTGEVMYSRGRKYL